MISGSAVFNAPAVGPFAPAPFCSSFFFCSCPLPLASLLCSGTAFFSGKPNLAARFASTSSDRPRDVLSIGPAFSFFSAVCKAALGAAVEPLPLDLGAAALADKAEGSKGRPNRSARALRACCSGVSSVGAGVSALGGASVVGA